MIAKRIRILTEEQKERKRERARASKKRLGAAHVRAVGKAWREKNRDKLAAIKAAEYRADPEKVKARNRAWKEANPERLKRREAAHHRIKTYGITPSELQSMIEVQGFGCAICRAPLTGGWDTCVDHDHLTGLVRGLLCHNDNKALGLMRDDIHRIESALTYLKQFKDKQNPSDTQEEIPSEAA